MANRRFIKAWFAENGITQQDFAKRMDISRVHLSYIISGKSNPSKELADRISNITGLSFKRVMCGDENKKE